MDTAQICSDGMNQREQVEARVRKAWQTYQRVHSEATNNIREASRAATDEIVAAHEAGISVERLAEVLQRPVSVISHRFRHAEDNLTSGG